MIHDIWTFLVFGLVGFIVWRWGYTTGYDDGWNDGWANGRD